MLFHERLYEYSHFHSHQLPPYLDELERETGLTTVNPFMSCGPVMGRLLTALSAWLKPQTILEIGTFTGYSALCLAQHLPDHGHITCIEINAEYEQIIKKYFIRAGMNNQLKLIIGDALEVLPKLNSSFDLAFIDANKQNNQAIYELVLPLLHPGGTLIVDNVLWYGNVLSTIQDKETKAIHEFNLMVAEDKRVRSFILPIRDGIQIIQKL